MPKTDQKFFGPQHWNALAKDLRDEYKTWMGINNPYVIVRRSTIELIALRFAMRFKVDNSDFDPIKWLDQCSPNTDLYPFSEMWEEPKHEPEL